jgi:phosphoglycolate phosphatase
LDRIGSPAASLRPVLRFKLIIFDFDGTLADSLAWFLGISDQLADEFGFDRIDKSQLGRLRRLHAATLLSLHHVPLWKTPLIAARFRRLMGQQISQIGLFPGVEEMLEHLHEAGCALAVVTSNSRGNVRRVLGRETAALLSDCEGGVSLAGKHAKLRKILHRSGIDPDLAIFIGDEIRDIEAARRAGIASGAVAWGFTDVGALIEHAPDHVFTSMQDVLRTLLA